jgi:hypothetical protein
MFKEENTKYGLLTSIYVICIMLFSFTGCSSYQSIIIPGIVQDFNPDKGSFTLRTQDEKTIEVFVNADTKLDVKNTLVDFIIFEPGLSVRVDLEGKYAKLVEVNLAKVFGVIMRVEYSDLTLQPYGSSQKIELSVKIFSKIIKAGSSLPLNLLTMGRVAEVYFNPVTKTAFQITEMPPDYIIEESEEGSRTEGKIATFENEKLIINTDGGNPSVIYVDGSTTIIRPDGSSGSLDLLKADRKIRVIFNPITFVAIKIEIEE